MAAHAKFRAEINALRSKMAKCVCDHHESVHSAADELLDGGEHPTEATQLRHALALAQCERLSVVQRTAPLTRASLDSCDTVAHRVVWMLRGSAQPECPV